MVEIEEIEPEEETCSELELEDNPGDALELEENPGDGGGGAPAGDPDGPSLEENVCTGGAAAAEEEEAEEEWEIPFAAEEPVLPTDTLIEVRLARTGGERLGLVLDDRNNVVALREGTPAARSGEIFVGDAIVAVQGVEATPERRVAQLLRELPDAAV